MKYWYHTELFFFFFAALYQVHMDIVRTLWIVNFFSFVLILIFMWSKIYLVGRRIDDIISIVKKCDDLPEIEAVEAKAPATPSP